MTFHVWVWYLNSVLQYLHTTVKHHKICKHFYILYTYYAYVCDILVAEAVADINRAVSEGDAKATLAALQRPDAGLRAVLPECAHVYQSQLSDLQSTQTEQGNCLTSI